MMMNLMNYAGNNRHLMLTPRYEEVCYGGRYA
jgi:hypothetical protein